MSAITSALNPQPDPDYQKMIQGLDVDMRLGRAEVRVQRSWARALARTGYLTSQEVSQVERTLDEFLSAVETNSFPWAIDHEDIHLHIEHFVTERHPELGKRIHYGRSRNDLIATTLRLFVGDECGKTARRLTRITKVLVGLSRRDADVIIPGYTHRQAAQPIRLSHYWNAIALTFLADRDRLRKVKQTALMTCPLGAASIAGTHISVDLEALSSELGFQGPCCNSLLATGDRDFIIELGHALQFIALHISRLTDEIIFWTSTPVQILNLCPRWASGSSLMPNKRNPDFYELIRAKSKRLALLSSELLYVNFSLPLGYSSDFHEQKRTLMRALDESESILEPLGKALGGLSVSETCVRALLEQGHILATDQANDLVQTGLSFRDAYMEVASGIVKAEQKGPFKKKSTNRYKESVERRANLGGTALSSVMNTLKMIELRLEQDSE